MAPIWLVGGVILLASGFGAALVPWLRARQRSRRIAWSTARAAIDSAAITRDAARDHHPEAEQLLARAEALAAAGGGPARGAGRGRLRAPGRPAVAGAPVSAGGTSAAEFLRWAVLGVAWWCWWSSWSPSGRASTSATAVTRRGGRQRTRRRRPGHRALGGREMTALVDASPVVRLPGAMRDLGRGAGRAVVGDADVRILVAPPGLDKDERSGSGTSTTSPSG